MSTSIYKEHEYVVVTCGATGCSQVFCMSRRFYDETHRTGRGWYCPEGHARVWRGETTEQKLRAAEARETSLRDQLCAAEADAEASRVRLLKERQRIANGVCPCCNRSFTALARHIAAQHPGYDPGDLKQPKFRCSCTREFDTARGLGIHQSRNRGDDWLDTSQPKWRRHLTVTS